MGDFSGLLQEGATKAWLFIPSAILLGALHGLEPGHSKTMMAAFIVAIRGTIWQAALLGFCAAFSHSLVIWGLAAAGLAWGQQWNAETTEPYFQLGAGIMVIGTALWMAWKTYRDVRAEAAHGHSHSHEHHHDHPHPHTHGHAHENTTSHHGEHLERGPNGGKLVDLGHSLAELSIFDAGVPPRFELRFIDGKKNVLAPENGLRVMVTTLRPDGIKQDFEFIQKDEILFSTTDIPEPHEFTARVTLDHGGHAHYAEIGFSEADHEHSELIGLSGSEYQDAHEREHALEIQKRFASREVTTGQIILFGLSGGLLPCPAALTVLLLCLQLKHFTLGFALVACFSLGLALTLVATGTLAAWSVHHASRRFKDFSKFVRRVPYFSSAVLIVLGIVMIASGVRHLL
jgi:nickel/cobalt exporter